MLSRRLRLELWRIGHRVVRCVFFLARRLFSTNDKPKAYSPVNVLGLVDGDSRVFKIVEAGDQIVIDKET